jgi:hypothetical protein
VLALPLQDLAKRRVRFRKCRRERERLLARGKGVFEAPLRRERAGQAGMGGGKRRLQLDGLGVGTRRLGEARLPGEEIAEMEMRSGLRGAQGDGLPNGIDGLLEAAQLAEDDAEIEMRIGIVRPQREALADVVDGSLAVAGLVGDEAEMMQARGVARVDVEDAPVRIRRLGEPARLQVRHRIGEGSGQPRVAAGLQACAIDLSGGPPLFAIHPCLIRPNWRSTVR